MLWLSLLILLMSGLNFMLALPLQTPDLHAKPHVGLSEADQEFAEVFITLYLGFDLVRKYGTQPAEFTVLCAVMLFCSVVICYFS